MAFNFSPKIVTNGLVLSLDAANPKSYVSGSTSWNDLTGNGNNTTLFNGLGYDSSFGGNMSFDGVNDYAATINSMTFNYNSVSIIVWFNTTQNADSKIFSNNLANHPIGTYFGKMRVCMPACIVGTTTINDGTWRMATLIGSSTAINLYLNNITTPEISTNFSTTTLTTIPSIGAVGDGVLNYYYSGKLANLMIYNRPISILEILQNYNALKGRFGLT